MRIARIAVVLLLLAGPARALAPGDLDPTFNGGVVKLLDLAKTAGGVTRLSGVRVDAAGRIVLAGDTADADAKSAIVVARLGPDGALDGTFGEGGSRVTQAGRGGGTVFSLATSLIPRPGGAGWIVTGGASATDGRQAVLALAVDETGALDLGFGSGGSTRVQPAGPAPEFTLAFSGDGGGDVGADGSVIVAHTIAVSPSSSSNRKLTVVKLTADGQPANFAVMGVYVNTFSQFGGDSATSGTVARIVPEGVVVAGATLDSGGNPAFLVLRLTAGGLLDTNFSGVGYRVLQGSHPAAPNPFSAAYALAADPAGIYVAGTTRDEGGYQAMAVLRFTSGGLVDTAFGDDGVVRVQTASADPGSSPASIARAVAVQADGRIILAGSSGAADYTEIVVVRLTTSGALDPSFGVGGIVRLQPSTGASPESFAFDATISPDGNSLLVVGQESGSRNGVVGRILLASPPTTTTTLPPGCALEQSLAAALCGLGELGASVQASVPPGRLRDRLLASIAKSTELATASDGQTGGRRKKSLKRARGALLRLQRQLGSKKARRTLAEDLITGLQGRAAQIATTFAALRAPA
jgi:uncharacterized delta-60 repeat protein